MKLVFTLAASAFLATVPITASPINPNTLIDTAVSRKEIVIVSSATVPSGNIHPTTVIVVRQPEVSEIADETDSDVDESGVSEAPDYATSDSENDSSDGEASDDDNTVSHLTTREDGTCSGNSSRLCVEKDKCLCAECKPGTFFENCKFTAMPDGSKIKKSVVCHSTSNSGHDDNDDSLPDRTLPRRDSHTAEYWKAHSSPIPHDRRSSHTAEYWKAHSSPVAHNRRDPQSHTADYWNHRPPATFSDAEVDRRSPGHSGIKCTKPNEFPYCPPGVTYKNTTFKICSCASYQWNAAKGAHYLQIMGPAERDDSDARNPKRGQSDNVDVYEGMPVARRGPNWKDYHCSDPGWAVFCSRKKKRLPDNSDNCYCFALVYEKDFPLPHAEYRGDAIKNEKRRDVSSVGDRDMADLVPFHELSGGDLVSRKLAASYSCTDRRAKVMCDKSRGTECWCYTEEETAETQDGESMERWVKDDKPVQDADSESSNEGSEGSHDPDQTESHFETNSKRGDILQFAVTLKLPANIAKAISPKKRDLVGVAERDVKDAAASVMAERMAADVPDQDQHDLLYTCGNNGYGTRKIECKGNSMVAGFCLINGYCYCLQCQPFPDCHFKQSKGVGDDKRKRYYMPVDTIEGSDAEAEDLDAPAAPAVHHHEHGGVKEAREQDDINTLPKEGPFNMKISVLSNNSKLDCQRSWGGFCYEEECYCVVCSIGLNNCEMKKVRNKAQKREIGNGSGSGSEFEQLGDGRDDVLHGEEKSSINEKRAGPGGMHRTSPFGRPVTVGRRAVDEKRAGSGSVHRTSPFGCPVTVARRSIDEKEKRGGSNGIHRTSPFGHPVTVGRRNPMPMHDDHAILQKTSKAFTCTNALGAFCFANDECFCLRCNKFPEEGCKFEARKFFTHPDKREASNGTTISPEPEDGDIKPEITDVVTPPTISVTPSNTSADVATATITRNPNNIPNHNTTDLDREPEIFARGKTHAGGYYPCCKHIKDIQWGPICGSGDSRDDCHCMNCKDGWPTGCKWVDPEWVKDDAPKKRPSAESAGVIPRGRKSTRSPFLGMHHSVPSLKVANTTGQGLNETIGGGYGAGRTEMERVEKVKARDQSGPSV